MAKYPDIVTTNKGRDLISQTNSSNKAVKFTKVMVGDGELGSTDIQQMTALLSPKMTLPLTSGEDLKNGHARLNFAMSNSNLANGFYAKEIGVFAQVESGPEVLFAYTNGGNYVDYIPDKSTPIASQVIEIDIVVGNAQNVQVVLSDDTYITVKELEDHNKSAGAHANLLAQFEKTANLGDDIIKKLALTTAISVVSSLQSNSWFSQLLKWALTASGVRYNLATSGYVCFGALFGGLIIQWGTTTAPENYSCHATLPVAFTSVYCVAGNGSVSDNDAVRNHGCAFIFDRSSNSQITFRTTSEKAPSVCWIAAGY